MNLRGRGGTVIVAGGLACLGDALFLVGCTSQNAVPNNDAEATGGANAVYAMYTTQSMPPTLCLLTLTSSGTSPAVVNPFPVPVNTGALLVSDSAGSPHAFVATASSITHFRRSSGAGTWPSDTLDLAGQLLSGLDVVSTNSGLAALFTTHLLDPGWGYAQVVRL